MNTNCVVCVVGWKCAFNVTGNTTAGNEVYAYTTVSTWHLLTVSPSLRRYLDDPQGYVSSLREKASKDASAVATASAKLLDPKDRLHKVIGYTTMGSIHVNYKCAL